MSRKIFAVFVLLTAALTAAVLLLAVPLASAYPKGVPKSSQRPYRCFRPFSALRTFTAHDMQSKENCDFGPFLTILDATANVTCAAADAGGCTVNISFVGRRFDTHGKQDSFEDDADAAFEGARYTLELRAIGASKISYKGFDDTGYSVCCAMLHEAECEWVNKSNGGGGDADSDALQQDQDQQQQREQVVRSCALHDASYDMQIVDGRRVFKPLHGSVARPLHRRVSGAWEARIEFYRKTTAQGIGRIVIPFSVPMLNDPEPDAASGSDGDGGAVADSEAVAVVSTKE